MKCASVQRILFCVVLMGFSLLSSSFSAAYEKEVSDLCGIMSEKIAKTGKKTIAVIDFTDLQGNVTELGRFLAEEFSVKLTSMGKGFEVVDRTNLKSIIAEHKLSATGMIDPQTARQLGKFAGVNALVAGTITPFGDTIRLSLKVLDAETAKIITADTGNIPKTKAVEELLAGKIDLKIDSSKKPDAASSPDKTHSQEKTQVVEASGFIFELKEFPVSGQKESFSILITNKEKDRRLYIDSNYSRIFDDSGNEYKGTKVFIGNRSGIGSIDNTLITDIPVKAGLSFEQFSSQAKMIKVLEINCSAEKNFNVKFYNIPLKR